MRQRAFEEMRMAPELRQAMIDFHGFPPDNFVESGQGTIANLPNLDADPEARSVLEGLRAGVAEVIREREGHNGNGNGNGDRPEQTSDASQL